MLCDFTQNEDNYWVLLEWGKYSKKEKENTDNDFDDKNFTENEENCWGLNEMKILITVMIGISFSFYRAIQIASYTLVWVNGQLYFFYCVAPNPNLNLSPAHQILHKSRRLLPLRYRIQIVQLHIHKKWSKGLITSLMVHVNLEHTCGIYLSVWQKKCSLKFFIMKLKTDMLLELFKVWMFSQIVYVVEVRWG